MKIKSKLPISTVNLPISKISVKIHPYTIKEEKILLLAKDAKGKDSFISAMIQIVDNCIVDSKIHAADFPMADLTYLFIQIRAHSVSEISELRFTCKKEHVMDSGPNVPCNGIIEYDLNLNELDVINPITSDTINLDSEIGLGIKLSPVTINAINKSKSEDDVDTQIKLIYDLMICLFDNETIETKDDITIEEFKEFIESLPSSQLKKIVDYIDNSPVISKTIDLKCPKCGNETKYTLKGISDFF